MARSSFAEELEYTDSMGLDTTSPLPLMKPGYVREAKNCNLFTTGGYEKRDGYITLLTTPLASHSFTAGIQFKTSAGVNQEIAFGTTGASGRLVRISAGSTVDIRTGLSGSDRPSLVQMDDRLFFYNGDSAGPSPFLYDGSGTRQIGISPPGTAPTGVSNTNGSLVVGATYQAAYTYYNSQTGAESSPSPVSASVIVLADPNDGITWTVVAGNASTADIIRLYRTVANGNRLFLDNTASISATAITSTQSDAELEPIEVEFDNSRITDFTDEPNFAAIAQNRVFVKSGTNEVRYSKIGQSGPMPESFEAKAFVNTEGRHGASDDIVGLGKIKDVPVVLKERSVGILEPVGIGDSTSSVDNVIYLYRELDSNIGAVAHQAGDQVGDFYVFLGRDNVYGIDGSRVIPLADTISATIQALGFQPSQRPKVSALNDVDKKRIYFAVYSESLSSTPDLILVGDYQKYPAFRWTTYEQGADTGLHPGILSGSFWLFEDGNTGRFDVHFGNTTENGQIYELNNGADDSGFDIDFKVVSRPYAMGQPLVTKLFKTMQVFAQGADDSYQLEFCAIYDLNGMEIACDNFTLPNEGGLWDDNDWAFDDEDDDTAEVLLWSGEAIVPLWYKAHRKAKFQQLVFKQPSKDAPVILYGWGTSGVMQRPDTPPTTRNIGSG